MVPSGTRTDVTADARTTSSSYALAPSRLHRDARCSTRCAAAQRASRTARLRYSTRRVHDSVDARRANVQTLSASRPLAASPQPCTHCTASAARRRSPKQEPEQRKHAGARSRTSPGPWPAAPSGSAGRPPWMPWVRARLRIGRRCALSSARPSPPDRGLRLGVSRGPAMGHPCHHRRDFGLRNCCLERRARAPPASARSHLAADKRKEAAPQAGASARRPWPCAASLLPARHRCRKAQAL